MAEYEIRPARPEDIDYIAAHMRKADREEVLASHDQSPHEALAYSLQRSDWACTGLADGVPGVMWGVGTVNILCGIGAPWLLGTDAVGDHYRQFLRHSVEWKLRMLREYNILRNVVDDRNVVSKRWLRWLGFSLGEPFRIGKDGLRFRQFEMRADNYVRNISSNSSAGDSGECRRIDCSSTSPG